jgi:hypothetical protein
LSAFGNEQPFSHAQSVLLLIPSFSAASFCEYPAFTLAAFNVNFGIFISPFRSL